MLSRNYVNTFIHVIQRAKLMPATVLLKCLMKSYSYWIANTEIRQLVKNRTKN